MKKKLAFLIISYLSLTAGTFAVSMEIRVEELFTNEYHILEVSILKYTDSIMTCVQLDSKDTLEIPCKNRSWSEALYINNELLSGMWPKVGGKLILLTNYLPPKMVFFAKRIKNNTYRFWDPRSIPFANTVFLIPRNSDFKPIENCDTILSGDYYACSDGFICSSSKLESLRNKGQEDKSMTTKHLILFLVIVTLFFIIQLLSNRLTSKI